MFVHLEHHPSGLAIRSPALFAGQGVHDANDEGFMVTPAQPQRKFEELRGPNWHGPVDAVRRSAGVAPSLAVNRRCGIRLAPGDRRPRRRRGRPLFPRSARGRPLTAAAGAKNRAKVIDDGKRRGDKRPTRHQTPNRGPNPCRSARIDGLKETLRAGFMVATMKGSRCGGPLGRYLAVHWSDKAKRRTMSQVKGFMAATMNPSMMEQGAVIMEESSCVSNPRPSSLYANTPTESTAAEPQPSCKATRQRGRVLTLVCRVGDTFVLLTRTEESREHDCRPSPSVPLL